MHHGANWFLHGSSPSHHQTRKNEQEDQRSLADPDTENEMEADKETEAQAHKHQSLSALNTSFDLNTSALNTVLLASLPLWKASSEAADQC